MDVAFLKDTLNYKATALALALISAFLIHRAWYIRGKKRGYFAVRTAMDDLDVLKGRSSPGRLAGTAIIVGGSMTGLIAARICADHFERVVIIEADEGADTKFPAAAESKRDAHGNTNFATRRSRVAQTFAVHFYQPFALLALRRLIPNFDEKFIDAGGRIKPFTYNLQWSGVKIGLPRSRYLGGRWFPRHHNIPKEDLPNTIYCTRANLEIFLRREILEAYPGIEVVNGAVTSLVEGADGSIKEVVYMPKGQKSTKTMNAALVVDCTGPSKAGVKWLEHLNRGPIPQVSYDPLQRYATVWFKVDEHERPKIPIPDDLRDMGFYLFALEDSSLGHRLLWASNGENGTIALSFGGFGTSSEELPRRAEELKEFVRGWKTFDGKPMDGWYIDLVDFLSRDGGWERAHYEECKIPPCVFVKYHEVARALPKNFVALGDAVMRSSPAAGLGVTKGMVGAVTLAGALDRVEGRLLPENFAEAVMISQNKRTGWLWNQLKTSDYGYDTTIPCEGDTLELGASQRALMREFFHLTAFDEEASAYFYYTRLWMYPGPLRFSRRVLGMAQARLNSK